MKKLPVILLFFSCINSLFAQDNREPVSEPICYAELISGNWSHDTIQPYKINEMIYFDFKSGYEIGILLDLYIEDLRNVLSKYEKVHINAKAKDPLFTKKLGQYFARHIKLVSEDLNPRKRLPWGLEYVLTYKYHKSNEAFQGNEGFLEISIPEMKYFATSEKMPAHTIIIPNKCVDSFIRCFE